MTQTPEGQSRMKLKVVDKVDDNYVVDRISQLPDDILVSIISRLTFREATATSVLSSRWQPLHTLQPCLNFSMICPELPSHKERLGIPLVVRKFRNFVNMVNHTLDSYKGGQMLKEFRIHMYCLEGANIKRWLQFALSAEVEIIDICIIFHPGSYERISYCLQLENLIKSGCQTGLKCLKELSLRNVGIDDVEIKLLGSNFPNLERLVLKSPHKLINFSMVGHPKLQHLSISDSLHVKSIEIKDMINLISLTCCKLPCASVLRFNNLPKLIELETSEVGFMSTVHDLLSELPSCIRSQLLVVRLKAICMSDCMSGCMRPDLFPELINVKSLELEFKQGDIASVVDFLIPLLIACHNLEKLEMKSVWRLCDRVKVSYGRVWWAKEVSPKLNEVKLSGYMGYPVELRFAAFIVAHASSLHELIVEPCRTSDKLTPVATANILNQLRPLMPESLNFKVV